LTAPGSLNTKSAWTEIGITTAPFTDICATVGRDGNGNAGASTALLDIGCGPAGQEVVLIADTFVETNTNETIQIFAPCAASGLEFPVGTRLAARYQRASTAIILDCCVTTSHGKRQS
jgi:hypothetical protein